MRAGSAFLRADLSVFEMEVAVRRYMIRVILYISGQMIIGVCNGFALKFPTWTIAEHVARGRHARIMGKAHDQ